MILELLIAHADNRAVMLFDTRHADLGAQPAPVWGAQIVTPSLLKDCVRRAVNNTSGYTLLGFIEAKNGRRVYGVLKKEAPGFFARLFSKKPKVVNLP